jgi:hypothetical protein
LAFKGLAGLTMPEWILVEWLMTLFSLDFYNPNVNTQCSWKQKRSLFNTLEKAARE